MKLTQFEAQCISNWINEVQLAHFTQIRTSNPLSNTEPRTPSSMTVIELRQLRTRLQHLHDWILSEPSYEVIWDLCCDHGRLGLHLHQNTTDTEVHLIDCVPSLIERLETQFSSLKTGRLHFTCIPGEDLRLAPQKRQVVIVAGVGGETCIEILQGILVLNSDLGQFDILLSPNSHPFELREFLRKNNMHLLNEQFITDRGRSHEHILVRAFAGEPYREVSVCGDAFWLAGNADQKKYLDKNIKHYEKILGFTECPSSARGLQAYRLLLARLF